MTASAAQAEDVNAFVASLDAQKMKGLIAAADDATIAKIRSLLEERSPPAGKKTTHHAKPRPAS